MMLCFYIIRIIILYRPIFDSAYRWIRLSILLLFIHIRQYNLECILRCLKHRFCSISLYAIIILLIPVP